MGKSAFLFDIFKIENMVDVSRKWMRTAFQNILLPIIYLRQMLSQRYSGVKTGQIEYAFFECFYLMSKHFVRACIVLYQGL